MGLFDYITCDLAIEAPPNTQFQTKSFDAPYMEKYRIDKDGHIWHERCEYKFEPDETREGIWALMGSLKTTKSRWVRLDSFRGEVVFYTNIADEWHEYSALFDNGECINLKRV